MIKSLIKSGIFWTLFVSAIVTAIIIFAFPYFFESFEELNYRLLIALSFFFIIVIFVLLYVVFLQEKTQKKIKSFKEKRDVHVDKQKKIDLKIKDIKIKFNEALKILKNSTLYRNKRRARYELPWYLLVGKEKEGKTTLLEASGLEFPLNINYDHRSVKEEGTSQGFLWYYAEHAIFIDMPGKYIEQDLEEVDKTVWEKGFLKIFAKKRLRRPLNGILLNISVDTFINKSEKELEQYAKDLRDRFDELSDGFASSIPIYLIITKSDRIVGYNEYFSTLSEDEREEILGITFDNPSMNIDTTVVRPELEKLLKRIHSSVVDKLHQEWDEDIRSKIFLFPNEFSNIFEKIGMFTDICFSQTRYRKSLMLRGIYFTSVPADQEAKTSYLLSQKDDNKLSTGRSSKGYFIKKLLQDIIFPESDLIKMDESFKKINKKRQVFALSLAVLSVLILSTLWVNDFVSHNNLLHNLEKRTIKIENERNKITSKDSLEKILPILNEIKSIKDTYENEISDSFYRLNFYNVEDRTTQLYSYYQNTLATLLLPRVEKNLNKQVLLNLSNYDRTWKNTELYLMLNDEKHRNNDYLKTAMGEIWAKTYSNKHTVQNNLNEHFKNLLSLNFSPYKLNKQTLKVARSVLYNKANVVLVYDELKKLANEKMNFRTFSFEEVLGTNVNVFSGDNYKIPSFFTKQGFETIIVSNGKGYVKNILKNNWVLGTRTDLTQSELDDVYSQVLSLYFKEYKHYWISSITKLNIPKVHTESALRNQLEVLSLANSPIISILQALKKNTNIYTPEELILIKARTEDKAIDKIAQTTAENKLKTSKLVANIKTVRTFFKPYHDLLKDDETPNINLENSMLVLNDTFQKMNDIFSSINPKERAFKILEARTKGKVEPVMKNFSALPINVDRWLKQVLGYNWGYLLRQSKEYIQEKYEENVYSFYQHKLQQRYPFEKYSNLQSVNLEDFKLFFELNGIFDKFYKHHIEPFININNISYKSYSFKKVDGKSIEFDREFMENMLRVFRLRSIFFDSSGERLYSNFYITPKTLDKSFSTVKFSYGNEHMLYEHGAIRDMLFTWPTKTENKASYILYDIYGNKAVNINFDGAWSLLKILNTLDIQTVSTSKVEVKSNEYEDKVVFYIKGDICKVFKKDKLFENFKLNKKI
ncbi:type VI secretion system membrane subunit TssM [Sulfurimonas lithotrophica]|uniref:Type VI secretion system membrane subunit TssM n=1 Tax=Sulfurimonas lithotrophica TaxID=2590022 RepID=A0A5P8NZZ8_9BACT|nr:type VI secretion system membrane subunit TssM [Sulfurimonas lithotrophica]QFR48941.1 type VI secretion system membrane subunit TssM [Sulfurimonas lithotrophica]